MTQVTEKPKHSEVEDDDDHGGKLIEDEKAMSGKVNLSVYKYYAESIGYVTVLVVLVLYGIEQGFRTGANIWLRNW